VDALEVFLQCRMMARVPQQRVFAEIAGTGVQNNVLLLHTWAVAAFKILTRLHIMAALALHHRGCTTYLYDPVARPDRNRF